jgi:hypothetical protein
MKYMLAFLCRAQIVLFSTIVMTACTPANPLAITFPDPAYSEEKVIRGVVNGFWEYDPERNATRLEGAYSGAGDELVKDFAGRYLVRVGIDRSYLVGRSLEVVVLPTGWTYSLDRIVDDGRTINLGDVVDVRGHLGTNLESVVAIVRKCNAAPVPGENKDWSIGCKRVETFDANGYGGDKRYLTGF